MTTEPTPEELAEVLELFAPFRQLGEDIMAGAIRHTGFRPDQRRELLDAGRHLVEAADLAAWERDQLQAGGDHDGP